MRLRIAVDALDKLHFPCQQTLRLPAMGQNETQILQKPRSKAILLDAKHNSDRFEVTLDRIRIDVAPSR